MIYSHADEMMAMNPVYGVYRYGTTSQPHSPPHRPVHSGRKGSKKVRTGCITCKIRKVKCDESKPYCLRCTKTGRKCDGYLDPKTIASRRRSRDNDGSPHSSLSALWEWASPEEKRSFHFFQHVTAPSLAGDIDAVFWKVLVLQICQTEPAVRHAVLAVSSLYEGLIQGVVAPYVEGSAKQSFALQQYNKAITCLLDRMHDPTTKPLGPLLTCILFVCIEFMQSKDKESLIHLEQGRQILSQLEQRASSGNPDSEMDVIKQHLVPMYTRLSITSFLFGGTPVPIPQSLKTGKEIPVVFQSLHELRSTLFEFVDAVLRFSQKARPAKYDSVRIEGKGVSHADDDPAPVTPEEMRAFELEQEQLMKQLAKLNVAFSLFKTTKPKEASETTASVAQMYLYVSKIWISTALTAHETAYDDHLPSFSAIVPLASTILEADAAVSQQFAARGSTAASIAPAINPSSTPPPQNSNNGGFGFGIETHVIPALFYVATKCRHPFVRHAALNLLKNNPTKRENLWRADMIGAIADHVVHAEERLLLDQKPGRPSASPDLSRSVLQVPSLHSKNPVSAYTQGRTPEDVWSSGLHGMPIPEEFKAGRSVPEVVDPIAALFEQHARSQQQQPHSSPQLHSHSQPHSQHASPQLAHSQPPQSHTYLTPHTHTPSKPSLLAPSPHELDLDLDMDLDLDSVPIDPALLLDPDVASMHSFSSAAPSYDASTVSVSNTYLNSGKPQSQNHFTSHTQDNRAEAGSITVRQHSMSPSMAAAHSPPLSMAESVSSGSEYGGARRAGSGTVPVVVLPSTPGPIEKTQQSTEAPFDLPEHLRIHDAIVGPETEEGSWVSVFRKLHGLHEDWDVQTEYVGAW